MVHVPDPFPFTPAVPRARHDGWTAAAQRGFVDALMECGTVKAACARVGRSPRSAYTLRRRADAAEFAAAWDAALAEGEVRLLHHGIGRCFEGSVVPVIYRGRVIAERTVHSDHLLAAVLLRSLTRGGVTDPKSRRFAPRLEGAMRY